MKRRSLSALVGLAVVAVGCGGSEPAPAPGSLDRPVVGELSQRNEHGRRGEATESPNEMLVMGRASASRLQPCDLVSAADARAILGAPVERPAVAPQGPTCVYRAKSGGKFVTVSVQQGKVKELARPLAKRKRVDVRGRTAYCGVLGQHVLYVAAAPGWVLNVAAPCPTARRFAASAVATLDA